MSIDCNPRYTGGYITPVSANKVVTVSSAPPINWQARAEAAEAQVVRLREHLEKLAEAARYARAHNLVGPAPYNVIEQCARQALEEQANG